MNKEHIKHLICPSCTGDIRILKINKERIKKVKEGILTCTKCHKKYPIINFIPRFVPLENYAHSFGIEWNFFSKTQYDSYSGIQESETRFFKETEWPQNLKGEVILEAGSGSGRFTEQVAKTCAFIISMDYSNAVEANYKSNGDKENVLIIQGDIRNMPFRKQYFDRAFCIGVLQHTPNPRESFESILSHVKSGGSIVVDIYKKTLDVYLSTKYFIRLITKNMQPETIFKSSRIYVDLMWPLCSLLRRISPNFGPKINWALGVPDYSRRGLKGKILKEWAYLDTFDMWSPKHTHPQTIKTVKTWFKENGFKSYEVHYGYNGIEGRGIVS